MFKKRLLKTLFCSNTKNLEDDAINFLKLINNLLTLILSKSAWFYLEVFSDQTRLHLDLGKVAIGLIRFSYKSSLSKFVSLVCASNTSVKPPRFKPAGANHSCPILSNLNILW